MNAISQNQKNASAGWTTIYKIGAIAALLTVLTGLSEILITFLPGGGRISPETMTVIDWFSLYQANPFMGMRNLGLINIILVALSILVTYALYAAHRETQKSLAPLAIIVAYIGVAIFYATNRAFPMLALSSQYAAAASETQRGIIAAAGQAMLAVGQSHTPGTFLAFFFSEMAGMLISYVMLRGGIFSRASAVIGLVAYACLFIFEICSSFIPALFSQAMIFAMTGGILSLVWDIMIARRLLQLAKNQS